MTARKIFLYSSGLHASLERFRVKVERAPSKRAILT
jgi:hypothetical protein